MAFGPKLRPAPGSKHVESRWLRTLPSCWPLHLAATAHWPCPPRKSHGISRCQVDLDSLVERIWQELYAWPMIHWSMIEALVAAFAFVAGRRWPFHLKGRRLRRSCERPFRQVWISFFFLLNELPMVKKYRLVIREPEQPKNTSCYSDKTKHRVWASFPVCLGAGVSFEPTLWPMADSDSFRWFFSCFCRFFVFYKLKNVLCLFLLTYKA